MIYSLLTLRSMAFLVVSGQTGGTGQAGTNKNSTKMQLQSLKNGQA